MYTLRTINGLSFRSLDKGPEAGDPVVLLHGFPEDATSWDAVTEHILAAGYRTIAPDLRGYSEGTRTGNRADYSVTSLVDDVAELIRQLDGQTHVVGHDWGGSLLWSLRTMYPELVATATVVSSPHPTALAWAMTHGVEQPLKSWYIGAIALPYLPEAFLQRRLASFLEETGLPADRATYYQQRANEPGAATAMLSWYRQMIVNGLPLRPKDSSPRRPRSSRRPVPTTYLWGTADRFLGRTAADKTAQRRDVTRSRFIDGGHWLPETHPEDVADAFLEIAAEHPR